MTILLACGLLLLLLPRRPAKVSKARLPPAQSIRAHVFALACLLMQLAQLLGRRALHEEGVEMISAGDAARAWNRIDWSGRSSGVVPGRHMNIHYT